MENKGGILLDELIDDPIKFSKNKFKGYDLLNEYLMGYDVKTLIPVLESNEELVYKVGVSIASELSKNSCSFLLPYLLPLLKEIDDPLYLHYLFSALFKATYNENQEYFSFVINYMNSKEYKIINSVMHLIIAANRDQLKKSIEYFEKSLNKKKLSILLHKVLEYNTLRDESVVELINSKDEIEQLFGGVIATKLYDKNPRLIEFSVNSSNIYLKEFSEEIIAIKEH